MYVFYPGGMSHEYADTYLKFHHDLKILQLDDTEMASLSAIALFSAGMLYFKIFILNVVHISFGT